MTGASASTATPGPVEEDKATAKFKKLMGIKEVEEEAGQPGKLNEQTMQKQADLFEGLDKQYAMARITTHTHRGIGLGFGSHGMPDPK